MPARRLSAAAFGRPCHRLRLVPTSSKHPSGFGSHHDNLNGDHFHEHHLDNGPPHPGHRATDGPVPHRPQCSGRAV